MNYTDILNVDFEILEVEDIDWLRSYLPYTNYMQRSALNIKQLNTAFINVHNYSIDYNKHWINNK